MKKDDTRLSDKMKVCEATAFGCRWYDGCRRKKDGRVGTGFYRGDPGLPEVRLASTSAHLQVYAQLFPVYDPGDPEVRTRSWGRDGGVARAALQPVLERWVRPRRVKSVKRFTLR